MEIFNSYNRPARIYPAIPCIIPVLIIYFYFLNNAIGDFVLFTKGFLKIAGVITVPSLAVFFFAHFGRSVGKFLYERICFKNQLFMPTTNYLLHSNDKYSDDYKNSIYNKIKANFNLELLSKEEEKDNETLARKKIVEAVGLIREKVKNGRLLLQYNIEYGFYRNLIGGSAIALLLSIFNWYFFAYIKSNDTAVFISTICIILYSIPVIFSKKIIKHHGDVYAEVLLKEYLSIS